MVVVGAFLRVTTCFVEWIWAKSEMALKGFFYVEEIPFQSSHWAEQLATTPATAKLFHIYPHFVSSHYIFSIFNLLLMLVCTLSLPKWMMSRFFEKEKSFIRGKRNKWAGSGAHKFGSFIEYLFNRFVNNCSNIFLCLSKLFNGFWQKIWNQFNKERSSSYETEIIWYLSWHLMLVRKVKG